MTREVTDVGSLVRHWRQRRRLAQQALSDQCGVSTRHLSYIETGRARPSPTMVGQLSEALADSGPAGRANAEAGDSSDANTER